MQVGRASKRQRAFLADQRLQIGPLDVSHRDVQQTVVLARVVDRDDVRVVDRGRQPRLSDEPLAEGVVLGEVGAQHLERHLVPEPHVVGPVDHAHAAPPEHALDPVGGELRADARHLADATAPPGPPRFGVSPRWSLIRSFPLHRQWREAQATRREPSTTPSPPAQKQWPASIRRGDRKCQRSRSPVSARDGGGGRRPGRRGRYSLLDRGHALHLSRRRGVVAVFGTAALIVTFALAVYATGAARAGGPPPRSPADAERGQRAAGRRSPPRWRRRPPAGRAGPARLLVRDGRRAPPVRELPLGYLLSSLWASQAGLAAAVADGADRRRRRW